MSMKEKKKRRSPEECAKERDELYIKYKEESPTFKWLSEKFEEALAKQENGGKLELQHPICILTCHNRKPSLLDDLPQISSKAYVFIYEHEKEMYSWLQQDNVEKVYVPKDYLSCQKMRYYIQGYMKDRIYWMLDDDLLYSWMCKKTKKSTVFTALYVAEKIVEKENLLKDTAWMQTNMCDISAKFWKMEGLVRGAEFCHQAMLFNGPILEANDCHFTGDKTVHEDVELGIELLRKGLKMASIEGLVIIPILAPSQSIASNNENLKILVFEGYKKFGEYCKLVLREAEHIIQVHVNKKECASRGMLPPRHDPEQLRLCEEKDFEGLYEYIKKRKAGEVKINLPGEENKQKKQEVQPVKTRELF